MWEVENSPPDITPLDLSQTGQSCMCQTDDECRIGVFKVKKRHAHLARWRLLDLEIEGHKLFIVYNSKCKWRIDAILDFDELPYQVSVNKNSMFRFRIGLLSSKGPLYEIKHPNPKSPSARDEMDEWYASLKTIMIKSQWRTFKFLKSLLNTFILILSG